MTKRLKVLVSVYACSPVRGSEPGMGWGFVTALSKYHDLWVITEKQKFQEEIKDSLRHNPELNRNVKFFFIEKDRHRVLRKIWPPSYYWYYRIWHRRAYKLAVKLHKDVEFDVVHQLNMVGFREPGYLWKLDTPFVWGPIGGFVNMPWRFFPLLGLYGTIYYSGRNFINSFQVSALKRPKRAAHMAGVGLISATSDTAATIKRRWGKSSQIVCEVGLPQKISTTSNNWGNSGQFRIVWCGVHTPRKALPVLLRALALINESTDLCLDILGDGGETNKWKKLAKKLRLEKRCHWYGWVSRKESLEIMKNGHVFIVTSLQDLTSTVIVEALSLGLPVICLDHCGFSDVVTPECGIKIPVTNPKTVIEDIAKAITSLAENEELRIEMSHAAFNRAKEYSWDKKAKKLSEIYTQTIEEWNRESFTRS